VRRPAGAAAWCLAGTLAALAGCREPEPTPAAPPAAHPPAAASPGTQAVPPPELPAPGAFVLWLEDGRVTGLAHQAPRRRLLEDLSRQGGFVLEILGAPALDTPITLRVSDDPLDAVLGEILADVPYTLDYAPGRGARPVLARLSVGDAVAPGGAPPPEPEPLASVPRPDDAEIRAGLEDRDPDVRAEAVRWLDLDTREGMAAASELLLRDPSPRVRAAAAESLALGDLAAVAPLLSALEDPDPDVVLAAVDAIEFVGDASVLPQLETLLDHPSPAVREAAGEAIEFLGD
jgi:hypothetical protein